MASDGYLLRCTICGTKNRIPRARVGQTAKCGRCGSDVLTDVLKNGRPLMVSDRDFEDKVIKSPLPVLLLFWASWCPNCKTVIPAVGELASEWKGKVRVGKLNVDQNQMTASRFQVMSVPTLMIFDKGQVKRTQPGAIPKEQIAMMMRPYIYR